MLKKSLPFLAGSILLASEAAAISFNPGDNVFIAFNTTGHGSYWLDLGISPNDFQSGLGSFQIDLTGATAALGGSIESFAMLGRFDGPASASPSSYNYTEFLYIDPDAGLLYAHDEHGDNPGGLELSNATLDRLHRETQRTLETANITTGYYSEGSEGDADSLAIFSRNAFVTPFSPPSLLIDFSKISGVSFFQNSFNLSLITDVTQLYRGGFMPGTPDICFEDSDYGDCYYYWDQEGRLYLDNETDFFITGYGPITALNTEVPLPGAAWFFISATGGLMAFRAKQ